MTRRGIEMPCSAGSGGPPRGFCTVQHLCEAFSCRAYPGRWSTPTRCRSSHPGRRRPGRNRRGRALVAVCTGVPDEDSPCQVGRRPGRSPVTWTDDYRRRLTRRLVRRATRRLANMSGTSFPDGEFLSAWECRSGSGGRYQCFHGVQFGGFLGGVEAGLDQVEGADEPVTDPDAACPDDGVSQWDRPLVLEQDQRLSLIHI